MLNTTVNTSSGLTLAGILQAVPFFSHLSVDQLASLAEHGSITQHRPGHIVVREGDAADSMYVILSGEVRVFKSDPGGAEIQIATLGEGSFFGELALLDQGARSATVACLTACSFFVLDQAGFLNLLVISDSSVIHRLFAALARRVRDTSERVFREELARQTLEANMEIERLRALSQMVAGVAHELNTPLGIINTAANMIEKRVRSEPIAALAAADARARRDYDEILEASQLIQGNIARAHRLVQDFKKISVNQLTDHKEIVNLPDLIRGIVDLFRINAKQARLDITISSDLPEGQRIWNGYPGYLTQVLMNLLTNVERYAYPAGKGGPIDIAINQWDEAKEPGFMVTVRDAGQGIPADNLPRIFDPFFTTGRSKGGAGLGMAIVHNIVTSALGGEIVVSSEVGQGTSVRLCFPQTAPDIARA